MSTEKLICPICGEPTFLVYGKYPRKDGLCKDCSQKLFNKEIQQCEDCGKWNSTEDTCSCKKPTSKVIAKELSKEDTANEISCIVCGAPSNGKHFCLNCYHKYKEKVILLKIIKCEFPTGDPIDESYEGVYECEDGHIVKSIAEQTIDNELCNKGIFHAYEAPLDIGEDKPLKPDFCLKNYLGDGKDVYIEYFGLKGQPKYDKHTEYKMKHYRRLGITLICLYPKDSKNLKFALQTKVFNKEKIKIGEINHEEK